MGYLHMTGLKKIFVTGFALVCGFAFSNAASAAKIHGQLIADTGTYAPIALGDALPLDGCGSVFDYNSNPNVTGTTVSLCNGVTDLTPFDFTWTVSDELGGFVGYIDGVLPTVTTGGVGDLIQAAGTYYLSLNVTLSPSSSTFALPSGDTGGFQPTFGPNGNQSPNSASHFSDVAVIVTSATSVPEPAAAFLLLPAMFYMARRQRKLRQQVAR